MRSPATLQLLLLALAAAVAATAHATASGTAPTPPGRSAIAAAAAPGPAASTGQQQVAASGYGNWLAVGELDSKGSLRWISWTQNAGQSPSFLAWASASRSLVAANEASPGGVTALQLAAGDSARGAVQTAAAAVDSPCHVALHPSGRWAATAAFNYGTVSVVRLATAASSNSSVAAAAPPQLRLGAAMTLPTASVGRAAHQVVFSRDGKLAYVPCMRSDWVRVFNFDAASGALTPHVAAAGSGAQAASKQQQQQQQGESIARLPPGSGPRHMAFHPSLPVAYVLNQLSNTIARFDVTPAGALADADWGAQPGRLTSLLPPGAAAAAGPGCLYEGASLALSADGAHLYASNRNPCAGRSSIAMFAVGARDGALAPLGWENAGGDIAFPRHISLTPPDAGSSYLLVANQRGASVTVLRRNASSGLLSRVATVPTAGGAGAPAGAAVSEPSFVGVLA